MRKKSPPLSGRLVNVLCYFFSSVEEDVEAENSFNVTYANVMPPAMVAAETIERMVAASVLFIIIIILIKLNIFSIIYKALKWFKGEKNKPTLPGRLIEKFWLRYL